MAVLVQQIRGSGAMWPVSECSGLVLVLELLCRPSPDTLNHSAIAAMQKGHVLDSFHSTTNGSCTRQDLIQDNTKAEDVSLLCALANRH